MSDAQTELLEAAKLALEWLDNLAREAWESEKSLGQCPDNFSRGTLREVIRNVEAENVSRETSILKDQLKWLEDTCLPAAKYLIVVRLHSDGHWEWVDSTDQLKDVWRIAVRYIHMVHRYSVVRVYTLTESVIPKLPDERSK